MIFQLLRMVERDAYRQALHDLDPVAGGVLRRQQREGIAGAGRKACDVAMKHDAGAISVGGDRHRLADTDIGKLYFLEIRIDPKRIKRHHRHQRCAGCDLGADLHAALRDHAIGGGVKRHVIPDQNGGAQARGRGQHIGIVGKIRPFDFRFDLGALMAGGVEGGARHT